MHFKFVVISYRLSTTLPKKASLLVWPDCLKSELHYILPSFCLFWQRLRRGTAQTGATDGSENYGGSVQYLSGIMGLKQCAWIC